MVGGEEVDCVRTFLMVFLGDLEGVGTFNPPLPLKLNPEAPHY